MRSINGSNSTNIKKIVEMVIPIITRNRSQIRANFFPMHV